MSHEKTLCVVRGADLMVVADDAALEARYDRQQGCLRLAFRTRV